MSIAATSYALEVAEGPPGRRAVLFALAIRANSHTAVTYSGKWLADAVGETDGSVRRHLHALAAAGLIALEHRPGRASVVRFPLAEVIHNPAQQCAPSDDVPRAAVRGTPRTAARTPRAAVRAVSRPVSGSVSGAACTCGARWIAEDGTCPICETQVAV